LELLRQLGRQGNSSRRGVFRRGLCQRCRVQKSNCEFAKAVAGQVGEEFYFDCVVRSTIERRVELLRLVGD
jgi:hypothetical protein